MSTSTLTLEQRRRWQSRPDDSVVMTQSWQKLLFLHWKYDPEVIQSILPPGLTVDTYDGDAWVGVVPFLMCQIRPVWSPAIPYMSKFLELNVRTYAIDEHGTPGVWFLSLSANRWIAVRAARTFFHLPYMWSKMSVAECEDRSMDYQCRQFRDPERRTATFRYTPHGTTLPADESTLDFFLAERYILFAQKQPNLIATGQVHHPPYQVSPATVTEYSEVPLLLDGLPSPQRPPDHAMFSPGVDVEVFGLKQL